MGQDSKIEWTHHTFNPWRGCTKVSDGCKNCYADTLSKRNPKALGIWGPSGTRPIAAESYWREPAKWNAKAKAVGEVHRVFCSSLADVGEGPETMPADACELVQAARRRIVETFEPLENLVLLLLTKRPENMPKFFPADFLALHWLGTSVENQKTAEERIPHLLRCPAAVRFLSCEPLLGAVDLTAVRFAPSPLRDAPEYVGVLPDRDESDDCAYWNKASAIQWVIVGGESGPGARPMHSKWARDIRRQCAAADVSFFFKQWGEWLPVGQYLSGYGKVTGATAIKPLRMKLRYVDASGQGMKHAFTENGVEFTEIDNDLIFRVGKAAAGRRLDGVTHDAMPTAAGVSK